MQWRVRGKIIQISEPYGVGHVCTARDAKDLNLWHANRVRKSTEVWLQKQGEVTREELDEYVRRKEKEFREKRPTKIEDLKGYEEELRRQAEAMIDPAVLLTQEERNRQIKGWMEREEIQKFARIEFEKKMKKRGGEIEDLLDDKG